MFNYPYLVVYSNPLRLDRRGVEYTFISCVYFLRNRVTSPSNPSMSNSRATRLPRQYSPEYSKQRDDFDAAGSEPNSNVERANIDETSARDVFKNLIQRDPSVCNHCFSEKYDSFVHEYWTGDTWMMRKDRQWADESGNLPAEPAGEGTRPTCACGSRYEHYRPISVSDAIEFAHNLSNSLRMRGVDHDKNTLIDAVHDLARRPENQHRQDEGVFQAAIGRSLPEK